MRLADTLKDDPSIVAETAALPAIQDDGAHAQASARSPVAYTSSSR
jgi:hypothetical protein